MVGFNCRGGFDVDVIREVDEALAFAVGGGRRGEDALDEDCARVTCGEAWRMGIEGGEEICVSLCGCCGGRAEGVGLGCTDVGSCDNWPSVVRPELLTNPLDDSERGLEESLGILGKF